MPLAHTLVDTALGPIGIAWNDGDLAAPLVRLQLPAGDAGATEAALTARLGSTKAENLPPAIARLAEMVRAYASGEPVDFSAVPVDFGPVEPLRRAIYAALRTLRHGQTVTYGELAERAGFPGLAQAVGQAMGRNPVPLVVPCHRVVAAGGRLGGFTAPGGAATKEKMLLLEGAIAAPAQADLFG